MLTKISMKLKCEEPIKYQMSSLFHGALMERVDPVYADKLHISQLHPYSTHLESIDREWYWVVCTLNDEARKYIINDVLMNMRDFKLTKKELDVRIVEKTITELDEVELTEEFYKGEFSKYIHIQIMTPLAFKHDGKYMFMPDVKFVYRSLMKKYSVASDVEMFDEETLDNLSECTNIIQYDIRTFKFPLEGISIPGFLGTLTFRVDGPQTMINFANVLFKVGEYSGVGIKNSLGMGAIKIQEERK